MSIPGIKSPSQEFLRLINEARKEYKPFPETPNIGDTFERNGKIYVYQGDPICWQTISDEPTVPQQVTQAIDTLLDKPEVEQAYFFCQCGHKLGKLYGADKDRLSTMDGVKIYTLKKIGLRCPDCRHLTDWHPAKKVTY